MMNMNLSTFGAIYGSTVSPNVGKRIHYFMFNPNVPKVGSKQNKNLNSLVRRMHEILMTYYEEPFLYQECSIALTY